MRIGDRQKKAGILLPPVSNVRVSEDEFLGASLLGEVVNPSSTKSLSWLARITFVCFDAGGNVIGGGFTFPPGTSNIPPGGRSGFDTFIDGLSASEIASVQVSVEPDYE